MHVIFPPQWSPFQPFLSTPSLKAYLEQKGFQVRQEDWNVVFYRWFIGSERLPLARTRLTRYAERLSEDDTVYRAKCLHALSVLDDHERLTRMVEGLRGGNACDALADFKASVDALRSLLAAFSTAEPVIEVGTTSLSHGDVLQSIDSLLAFLADRKSNPFIEFFERQVATVAKVPRYFGISIIGTEQIVSGLTLGCVLKKAFPDVPVLIGGSVFSRLVEKEKVWVSRLFEQCFDYICRFEGEEPVARFLASQDPRADSPPNFAFIRGGELVLTPTCEQLPMAMLPTPDFSELPLQEYLSPEIVLPLLTTRGCYWGKCAFCYHGMIYGDRYRMRPPELITQDVEVLNQRHGVRHFAFNDEALPPKLFRMLPKVMPKHRYFFTALYKFEKYYTAEDFKEMHDIGFRSVYIGLETASERLQRHMRKNNTQKVMVDNLQFAHDAGIWSHTFNFFGFPTETEAEAEETTQFLLNHANILHSEGTGTFVFEHNAPIHQAPEHFGVTSYRTKADNVLDLFYNYETSEGLDAQGAQTALKRFTKLKRERKLYQTGLWIQREHLLLLLSRYGRDELRRQLTRVESTPRLGTPSEVLRGYTLNTPNGPKHFVVNRQFSRVCITNEDAVRIVNWLGPEATGDELLRYFPAFAALLDPQLPMDEELKAAS
ncbi:MULTISPECIES: B12-binding domain-containing radical SAM protein [Corallococcus]|uniref:B12-binding domain-containing radical SAM protein n=1 Tax=Corallococcus TaxID=83461 RepID=UPI001F2C8D5D|nr:MULTISPECIES: radical SAM protein [Corallococcus]